MQAFPATVWLLAALGIEAQNGIVSPEFSAYQIGPVSGGVGGWLFPGELFSIYGKNLGPEQSCVRDTGSYRAQGPNSADDHARVQSILSGELCGVQVLIDEEAVPLIYVHERQIWPDGYPCICDIALIVQAPI